jgi:hypothetical protein
MAELGVDAIVAQTYSFGAVLGRGVKKPKKIKP